MTDSSKKPIGYKRQEGMDHELYDVLMRMEIGRLELKQRDLKDLQVGPDASLWLVQSGWLIGLRQNIEGDMKGTGLHGPGDLIGLVGLSGITKAIPFYALSDCIVSRIPTLEFTRMIAKDAKAGAFMVSYLSERYSKLLDELERSTLLPLGERIEAFISQMESLQGKALSVPQTVIAFAVGAHPVSISRLMNHKHHESSDTI